MASDTLFYIQSKEQIYQSLIDFFDHPGTLLFRGKELVVVNRYFAGHQLGKGRRVLDLGCGEGHIGNMLFNRIDVGLDVIKEEAEKAEQLPAYKSTVVADARSMPFDDGCFDLVFSNSVIEHINGIDEVLAEVSRVLRRRGLFVFTVPSHKFSDYLYFTTLLANVHIPFLGHLYSRARNRQLSHFNLFDDLEWEEHLRKVSLRVTYREYYLSREDIYEWDKMCILLRLSKTVPPVYECFKSYFYKVATYLLSEKCNLEVGGGLLVVAERCSGEDKR